MTGDLRVTLEEICTLPAGCKVVAVTADGHVVGECALADDRLQFLWDRHIGEPFDGIRWFREQTQAYYVSEDGTHVAYVASRGDDQFVGRDDAEDPPVSRVSGSVRPTFGGAHLAYGVEVAEGDRQLIFDGRSISTSRAAIAVAFSADGERLAYVEQRGEHEGSGVHRVVVDGQPGDWFTGMRNAPNVMQFSPDGHRFAYYAVDGQGDARWVVDGIPQLEIHDVFQGVRLRERSVGILDPPLPALFSPDGRRFAYFADVKEKGVAIVEDGVPGPLFKFVGWPEFSPDSRHLAYVGQGYGGDVNVILDGSRLGDWPATGSCWEPVFSPDSRHVAIGLLRQEGRLFRKRTFYTVAVDGRAFPEERADDISLRPIFSGDGSRLAWWLRRGDDQLVVLDGVVQFEWPILLTELRFDALGRLVYGGSTLTEAGETIMRDDRPGPIADAIIRLFPASEVFDPDRFPKPNVPFRLSPDGLHVAWVGRFGDEVRPVLDDEVGPGFDEIYECRFDADGSAVWWAQRGDTILRVLQES